MTLRHHLIRLAHARPDFRSVLLPLLKEGRRGEEEIVQYKGRSYRLLWSGSTRYGDRAKLQFMDGSKEFWADLSKVTRGSGGGGSGRGRGPMVNFRYWNGRVVRMTEEEADMEEDLGNGTSV